MLALVDGWAASCRLHCAMLPNLRCLCTCVFVLCSLLQTDESPRAKALAFFSKSDSDDSDDDGTAPEPPPRRGGPADTAATSDTSKPRVARRVRQREAEEDSDSSDGEPPAPPARKGAAEATANSDTVRGPKPQRRQSMKSGWEKHIMPSYGANQVMMHNFEGTNRQPSCVVNPDF